MTLASPYKGLAAFGDSALDALLFFGREREREAMVANVLATPADGALRAEWRRQELVASRGRRCADGCVPSPAATAVVVFTTPGRRSGRRRDRVDPQRLSRLGATPVSPTRSRQLARNGEIYLLLDQFEEYFLYHGADGPLSDALPELSRRPGLRVNVLDRSAQRRARRARSRSPSRCRSCSANLLRLDRLDRASGRPRSSARWSGTASSPGSHVSTPSLSCRGGAREMGLGGSSRVWAGSASQANGGDDGRGAVPPTRPRALWDEEQPGSARCASRPSAGSAVRDASCATISSGRSRSFHPRGRTSPRRSSRIS